MTEYAVSREPTDNFWEAVYTQRAIRYWEDRPVPDELIWKVIEAATKAPSGSNLQPWRFLVITSAQQREKVAQAVRERLLGAPGFRSYVERARESGDRSQRLMLSGAGNMFEHLERAPVLIVPCLFHVSSPATDPSTLLAGSSIYGAVQNLQLAARALGLGTVLTTAQARIEEFLRSEFGLPDEAKPVALVPMGFPAANFGPTNRRPVQEVTFWEGWDRTRERSA